jgi:hypothetical protein
MRYYSIGKKIPYTKKKYNLEIGFDPPNKEI